METNSVFKLGDTSVKELAIAVSDISGTSKRELGEIAVVLKEVREKVDDRKLDEVVQSNREVCRKLDGVQKSSDTFTSGMNKLERIFEKDIFDNVAKHS